MLPGLTADLDFEKESLSDAENFCRDTDQSFRFWCYAIPGTCSKHEVLQKCCLLGY